MRSKGRSRFIALCVAPATILFFLFMVMPTINVFRMSLFERGAYSPTETFVGMNNFKVLLKDTKFITSMQNTILLIVTVTIITFFFAIVFAAILTREKIKGQNFFRIVFYIPNILSIVVIAGIFSAIYKPDTTGMLNNIFTFFSGRNIEILWKTQPMVIVSIIIAMVWQAIGYYMVMYMASMSAVPASLFVKSMVAPGMADVGLSFMYAQKDAGLYGYSMAAGVIIFLFSFLLSALVNKVTQREVLEM